ncbi:MAG TPA: adenosylcobinamide-GDP ribazoletransferase [Solirubrobacterales bacterium]
MAAAFLTIVPVRLRRATPLGAAAPWLPVVGAALGAGAGAVAYVAEPALGPTVAAVLAVLVLIVLTGALHLDGLADCADAIGARGGGVERRLEVMRDSSIGTFGTLALGLWLALVIAALAGLDRGDAFDALLIAGAVGRWSALLHAVGSPPARRDGLGVGFEVSAAALAIGTVAAAIAALVAGGIGPGLAALGAGVVVAALVTAVAHRGVGGRTGDTLGATVVLTEAAVVVVVLGLA